MQSEGYRRTGEAVPIKRSGLIASPALFVRGLLCVLKGNLVATGDERYRSVQCARYSRPSEEARHRCQRPSGVVGPVVRGTNYKRSGHRSPRDRDHSRRTRHDAAKARPAQALEFMHEKTVRNEGESAADRCRNVSSC